MEDPRDTLDLSYEKQLEQLQKVRRGVADVATARKRIELQAQGLQKQADKLQGQAKAALAQGNEDLAREALARRAALGRAAGRAEDPARPDQRAGAEARADLPGAPGPGRALPHPEGDDEGLLHRGRGADQGGRGGVGDLGLHAQRRRHHAAGPGQDRRHAGAGGRHRRAAGVGRARRPDPAGRRHPEGARQGVVHIAGRQRAGGIEGRAGDGRWRRRCGRTAAASVCLAAEQGRRNKRALEERAPDGDLTQYQAGPGPDLPDVPDGVPPRPALRPRRRAS